MKKLLLLIILALSLAVTGCGGSEEVDEPVEIEEADEISYTIDIEYDFAEHSSGNEHLSVFGKTNLPDGEEILISVVGESSDYVAGSKDTVKDGIYLSEPFSDNGESLPGGEYKIIVETVEAGKAKQEENIEIE